MIIKTGKEQRHAANIVFEGNTFPVYWDDTLEKVVVRYSVQFPNHARQLAKEMKEYTESLYNENGTAREMGLLRIAQIIPQPIFYAMKFLDQDYWHKSNLKHYRHFAELCPKLVVGKL